MNTTNEYKGRILVVENNDTIAELLERALGDWGHEVEVTRSGERAFERIASGAQEYDLILCDLRLDGMPGKVLLDRIGAIIRGRTPVVVMSGHQNMIEVLGETRQWAFSVLAKPFQISHLRTTVEHGLGQRRMLVRLTAREREIEDLRERIGFLVRQNLELHRDARLDPLTRLSTRVQLFEDFALLQAEESSFQTTAVLCLADMDGFRRFNDDGGYAAGDRAIQYVADLIQEESRDCDRVYRWGGDEFVILIPCTSLDEGQAVMDRLREAVKRSELPGHARPITLSAGVAVVEASTRRSLRAVIETSNEFLREAKSRGGDCVVSSKTSQGPKSLCSKTSA